MAGLLDRVLGRGRGLDDNGRSALRGVLADPIFELLPLKSIGDQVAHLPPGARVSVTASPNKGIDATLDWAIRLQADGFRAIPAPVRPDDRVARGAVRPARSGPRRRPEPRVRRGWRRG